MTAPDLPTKEAALALAANGYAVFPVHSMRGPRTCSCMCAPCSSPGKHPCTRNGLKDATRDEAEIAAMWERFPRANVAVVTGSASSVFVLDIDADKGGFETLARLEDEHGALPATRSVRTGGGGRHLYFRHPGSRVPNSASKLGPGLDIRGDGGYVIAPPSNHASGGTYAWEDEREPVPAPEWLLARAVAPAQPTSVPAGSRERTDLGETGGTRYGLSALDQEASRVESTQEGERNDALNRSAFRIGRLVAGGELDRMFAARRLVEAALAVGLPYDEALRTTKSGIVHGLRRPRSAPPKKKRARKKRKQTPTGPRAVECTDLGNARRLAARARGRLLHCGALGWFAWDGRRWARDETGAAMRLAKETAEAIWDEVKDAPSDEREGLASWALSSQSAARLEAMLRLAATEEQIAVTAATFDQDPWVLNVANGTLDLRTGEILPHDPARHLTKLAPVDFDPGAACPRFLQFLDGVFGGNADLVRFVQKALGYALTGDVSFQVLFFLHGEGSNGKSTLVSVVLHVLGDYAAPAAPDILLSRHGERHPTEIADLFGRRLVTCVEVGKGRSFNEALLKWLTGGDRLKARHMRRDFFEFAPTHKIFICANSKPRVRETDHAFWRRMRLIPFDVKFVDRPAGATGEPGPGEKDPFLLEKLQAEVSGILRWMVEGCLALQREGLAPPEVVEAATEAYRQGEDVLGLFLEECCVLLPEARVRKAELYEAYATWAKQAGERAVSMREFRKTLLERGITDARLSKGVRAWQGIGLATDEPAGDRVTEGDRLCPMSAESPTRVSVIGQNASPTVTRSPRGWNGGLGQGEPGVAGDIGPAPEEHPADDGGQNASRSVTRMTSNGQGTALRSHSPGPPGAAAAPPADVIDLATFDLGDDLDDAADPGLHDGDLGLDTLLGTPSRRTT